MTEFESLANATEYSGLSPARVEAGKPRTWLEFQSLWNAPATVSISLAAEIAERISTTPPTRRPSAVPERSAMLDAAWAVLAQVQLWREEHLLADGRGNDWQFGTEHVSTAEGEIGSCVTTLIQACGDRGPAAENAYRLAMALRPRVTRGTVDPDETLVILFDWADSVGPVASVVNKRAWRRLCRLNSRYLEWRFPPEAVRASADGRAREDDDPDQIDADDMADRLMMRWNISQDPDLRRVLGRSAKRDGVPRAEAKRRALQIGVRQAFAARLSPWKKRHDGRGKTIVPSRDLTHDEFGAWLERESIRQAAEWLRSDDDEADKPVGLATVSDGDVVYGLSPIDAAVALLNDDEAPGLGTTLGLSDDDRNEVLATLKGMATPAELRVVSLFLGAADGSWATVATMLNMKDGAVRTLWKRLLTKYLANSRNA